MTEAPKPLLAIPGMFIKYSPIFKGHHILKETFVIFIEQFQTNPDQVSHSESDARTQVMREEVLSSVLPDVASVRVYMADLLRNLLENMI